MTKEKGGRKAIQHLDTAIWEGVKCRTRKGPTLLCFETRSSGEQSKAARAVNNRHILLTPVAWLLQTRTSNSRGLADTPDMQRQTEVGWKVGWVPEVGSYVTHLLFYCVWGDKSERGVHPSEMLLICSESEPFYSHNYPRLSEDGNWRVLEHQKIVDWRSRQQKQLGSLCFFFFFCESLNRQEADVMRQISISQRWETGCRRRSLGKKKIHLWLDGANLWKLNLCC